MARFTDPTPEQVTGWNEWISTRPNQIQEIAKRFDPWSLYRMKSTGQRVTIASFFENGTISVNITGDFNATLFDSNVFGIDPDDLEPCDFPEEGEVLGTMMSPNEVDDNVDALRVLIRPDLWFMDEDGVAIRKQ